MLTERQVPYTGPYGLATGPFKSKGPTAEACKRFFGRLGYIPWQEYDWHWNQMLGDAMKKYKKKHGLAADASYGKAVWNIMRNERVPASRPNAGEYCFDFYARKLIQDEAKVTADSDEMETVQYHIRQFWLKAIANADKWHYSQGRPVDVTVNPEAGGYSDCSAMCIQAVRYAWTMSDVETVDPAKWDFKGYGNTDLYQDDWPRIGSPFRIGDLAHFHSARHVIQCIKEGNIDTAQWGSNGSEREPGLVVLRNYYRYPDEFMFVVRPRLVAKED